jgi:hypothetical protein
MAHLCIGDSAVDSGLSLLLLLEHGELSTHLR